MKLLYESCWQRDDSVLILQPFQGTFEHDSKDLCLCRTKPDYPFEFGGGIFILIAWLICLHRVWQ